MPFEVPESWVWVRILDISNSIQYGYTGSAISKGKYKMLRITDIQDNFVDWKTVPFVEIDDKKAENYLLANNDIVFARTGATVGKSFLIKDLIDTSVFASYLIRIQLKEKLNAQYVKYFFESGYYWEQIEDKSVGTGQPNVNGTLLGELQIPVPPLQEQQRLVLIIEKCFALIDQIESNKLSLSQFIKQAKSKILDLAISGKLVPQSPNDEPASILLERMRNEQKAKKSSSDILHYPFEVPENWAWCRLENIAQHNTGKTLDKSRNTGILREYITTSNLYWGDFDFTGLRKMPIEDKELDRCTATMGDLLICEGGDAGRSAVWKSNQPICFQNHIHRVRPYTNISTDFLYYFMQYIYLNGEIKQYLKGIGIQSLSGNALASISIPLPPLSEQHRIVQKIETIFQTLNSIQDNL